MLAICFVWWFLFNFSLSTSPSSTLNADINDKQHQPPPSVPLESDPKKMSPKELMMGVIINLIQCYGKNMRETTLFSDEEIEETQVTLWEFIHSNKNMNSIDFLQGANVLYHVISHRRHQSSPSTVNKNHETSMINTVLNSISNCLQPQHNNENDKNMLNYDKVKSKMF